MKGTKKEKGEKEGDRGRKQKNNKPVTDFRSQKKDFHRDEQQKKENGEGKSP